MDNGSNTLGVCTHIQSEMQTQTCQASVDEYHRAAKKQKRETRPSVPTHPPTSHHPGIRNGSSGEPPWQPAAAQRAPLRNTEKPPRAREVVTIDIQRGRYH